jgi:DNA phosphorothioation-associated putative methyltransferase
MTKAVARHRTALVRSSLSRPFAQALIDQVAVAGRDRVFDFGCGRGDDLRHLTALGFDADGWDPAHRPDVARRSTEIVNLGYVVNVIEDRDERARTLREAWELAESVLIVSARLTWDSKGLSGRTLGDGILTRSGTFQKFFEHTELAAWIEQILGEKAMAAAPGIFYVFRRPIDVQEFLARRVALYRPRISIDPATMVEAHRDILEPLIDFAFAHGRAPRPDEIGEGDVTAITDAVGSLNRAFNLVRRVAGEEAWVGATRRRQHELLVYIALSRFGGRPRFSELPPTMAADIRNLFGSYQAACATADRVLFAAGKPDVVLLVARSSTVGKRTPSALYIHRSALDALPAVLRVYEGCAQVLAGMVDTANIIKLSFTDPQVSYLTYPHFDTVAHPTLASSVVVNLRQLSVNFRDYASVPNPPLLHRKEEFLPADHPRRALFARLTRAEVRAGLYAEPEKIGTLAAWSAALLARGCQVQGHRLRRAPEEPPVP